jgi:predicted enzyme related to lactoylglutathione lyase
MGTAGNFSVPMSSGPGAGLTDRAMHPATTSPVVHLELHTGDLGRALEFYARACGWRQELVEAGNGCAPYKALEGTGLSGGMVECPTPRALWLPYVEVSDITVATGRASSLGAQVLLDPREGPAGWRSVVSAPAGGEIAFWQPKR